MRKFREIDLFLVNTRFITCGKVSQNHSSMEKREILSHQRKISSNQLFSNLFSKTVTFTKFLPKLREREFP